jgi:hypothetical protein
VLRAKVDPQTTLWETLLPPELLRLPPGLSEIDALLGDPVFFEPFEEFFDPEVGRPSIPMETYLRMMFLRFRYRLGFETLCAELADSLAWRRFCRIGLTDAVPPSHRCRLRVANQLQRPHPLGPPTVACHRSLAAPAQRRGKRRGAGDHRRAGGHRPGLGERGPGRRPKCPANPATRRCRGLREDHGRR